MENEFVGKVLLDYKCYSGTDYYSDGEVEDVMLKLATDNSRDNFQKIIEEKQEWAITYHFSNERANIIDWLPITKDDAVLEIGSGCGAITWKLSEMAGSVECIELSRKRSLINANANCNCDNVVIHVGNFLDVEKKLEKKFDYITLIGVLEYAESYINTDNSYEDFICLIKRHLKPTGKIIIAIENKYGMKYWAGCKEDHFGKVFEGIEGYSTTKGVRTFSNIALEEMMQKNGLNNVEFFYPYPDYKFPVTIFSDNYLPRKGELNQNVNNFDNQRFMFFNEEKAFDNVIADGMFPFFSNSFLMIVGID